jgi:hypothetical protein
MRGEDGIWRSIKGSGWWRRELKKKASSTGEHQDYWKERYAQKRKEPLETCWIFDDIYYELFAILADVRNYEDHAALFPYRGIPILSSIGTRLEERDWGVDAHSWTYFSYKDIMNAKWSTLTTKTAWVPDKEWEAFLHHPEWKRPRSYCGSVWPEDGYHLRTWEYEYIDIAMDFFGKVVRKMSRDAA